MSKRRNNDTPTSPSNKKQKLSGELLILRDEKFKILEDKLRELRVTIKLTFITSISAGKLESQLPFIEFLLKPDNISRLKALQENNIRLTSISAILHNTNSKAAEVFNILCNKLLIQQDNTWIRSERLQVLAQEGINFTNLASILSSSGAKTPEAFESLLSQLLTQEGNRWVKSELLQALQNAEISFSNLSSILSGSGKKGPEAFKNLLNKLFIREGNRWIKSELLQTLANEGIPFSTISSILSKSGAKAPGAFESLLGELFVKQGDIQVKSELLQTLEREGIYLQNISGILHGAGAKAPAALDSLFNTLFIKQDNIWRKSALLQALENAGMSLQNISGMLNEAGARASEALVSLFNTLFIKQDNIWIKSALLQALQDAKIPFSSISSMLNGAGVKAPAALNSLFNKLFIKQDNIWIKSALLHALESEGIYLQNIASILSGVGAKADVALDSLVNKLFTNQDNRLVKSEALQALENVGISFSNISSILDGAGVSAPEMFDLFLSKLLVKEGNIWRKSEPLQALENIGIPFSNIATILNGSGVKAVAVLNSLLGKLLVKQDNIWRKSELLQALKQEGISLQDIGNILHGARAQIPKAFDLLFNKLFLLNPQSTVVLSNSYQVYNKYIPSEMLIAFKKIGVSKVFTILNGAGINAAKYCNNLLELLFIKQNNHYVLIPNIDPNSLNRQVVIQLISNKKSGTVNVPALSPNLFTDDPNYNDNIFHSALAAENIIDGVNNLNNLEYNIPELETVPVDDVLDYLDNLNRPEDNIPELETVPVDDVLDYLDNLNRPEDNIPELETVPVDDVLDYLDNLNRPEDNIPELETVPVDDVLDYLDNLNRPEDNIPELETVPVDDVLDYLDNLNSSEDNQSSDEYNLIAQCSLRSSRYKRFTENFCIIDSTNQEKFENEESYNKVAEALQSNQGVQENVLEAMAENNNRVTVLDHLNVNTVGHHLQHAYNMFMIVRDISNKDPEELVQDIGILYGLPKVSEFIEQQLIQLTKQYPAFTNIIKGGKIGTILNFGFNIYDLQDAIKSLQTAPEEYAAKIAEIRVTTSAGFMAISTLELAALCLGEAIPALAIASVALIVVSTLATTKIEADQICDELECSSKEYRSIFAAFLLAQEIPDSIKNNLQAHEIYSYWLDNVSQQFLNMTGFDAYITSLPAIRIQQLQTYTGKLEVISPLYPSNPGTFFYQYCGLNSISDSTFMEPPTRNVVYISSLKDSTKYSPHSRIIPSTSNDKVKLICNPTAQDVKNINIVVPKSNEQDYTSYCGNCIKVSYNNDDILDPEKKYYYVNSTIRWVCINDNIPCITSDDRRVSNYNNYYRQIKQECHKASGRIKSKGEITQVVLPNNPELDLNTVSNNYCDHTIALIKSSNVLDKADFNIAVLYQNVDVVKAANNKNTIIVKNNGSYLGGGNNDVFVIRKEINEALIDGQAGQDTIVVEGNLLSSSNFNISNVENLVGTYNSQRVDIIDFLHNLGYRIK